MVSAFHWLVKITGYPWQLIMMRKRIYYEDRSRQGRRIKGSAIVISNHTTAFDVAAIAFLFPLRTVRFVAAELMYEKNAFLSLFLPEDQPDRSPTFFRCIYSRNHKSRRKR